MVFSEEIISTHIIKPSSPTSNKLKTHKLSYLEQIEPLIYSPLIFFYQIEESKPHIEISHLLKESLSKVLTFFPQFAGTIKENSFVDCNDTGVQFLESRVHANLAHLINKPKIEELKQLVPVDSIAHSDNSILLVKVNFFDCGGIAIGVCFSHKVCDFQSNMVFLNAWAAICRGEAEFIQPLFDMAVHFPPRDSIPACYLPACENNTTKRLVFNKEMLEMLQRHAVCDEVRNPTKVEALSIFFWQQFIKATKVISSTNKSSFAIEHAMNLRPRKTPPIPDHTFGNGSIACFAFTSETTDTSALIKKLRVAKTVVDDNYINKVINSEEYLRMIYEMGELFKSGTELLCINSLWKFPVYDINFGWGKPVWFCISAMPFQNYILFMSTPSKDGIEAWINMSEDMFRMLEINYNKLFCYVTDIDLNK